MVRLLILEKISEAQRLLPVQVKLMSLNKNFMIFIVVFAPINSDTLVMNFVTVKVYIYIYIFIYKRARYIKIMTRYLYYNIILKVCLASSVV